MNIAKITLLSLKPIVFLFGEQRDANHFHYRISMSDPTNRKHFYFEDKPHSIREDVRQLLSVSHCSGFQFDENLINMFTDDINFSLIVNITNIEKLISQQIIY